MSSSGQIDADLVACLIVEQFPQWRDMPVRALPSAGTDNAMFRLGDEMVVRLPRVDYATDFLRKEFQFLPRMASLSLETPEIVALGRAGAQFPNPWLVLRWIAGDPACIDGLDASAAARSLGDFLYELQSIETADGPVAGPLNSGRGVPLAMRDAGTRERLAQIQDEFDLQTLLGVWEGALAVRAHSGPGVWVHGDIHAANLVQRDGRLAGVLDFGMMGVGDPAVDLAPAWNFLTSDVRHVFRDHARADSDIWRRGRGWALSIAASQLANYRNRNSYLSDMARRTLKAVLADAASS